MENLNSNNKPTKEIHTYELFGGLQKAQNEKNEIEELKQQGTFQSTIEELQEKIAQLKKREEELSEQIDASVEDDSSGTLSEYGNTKTNIEIKQKRLDLLTQDEDALNKKIEDFEKTIEDLAQQN